MEAVEGRAPMNLGRGDGWARGGAARRGEMGEEGGGSGMDRGGERECEFG